MDGSIHERMNSKGKKVYDVMYRVIDPKTGKKKQVIKRGFAKRGDAQLFITSTLIDIRDNKYVEPKKITVASLMEEWFEKQVKNKLAVNTVNGYRVNIYKHIIPNIGGLQLKRLTTNDVQDFYDSVIETEDNKNGLSAKSVLYIHRNLKKALSYAIKQRYIPFNPADNVELISPDRFTGKVYNNKTLMAFLRCIRDTEVELPVALAGLSGLRRGEVAGLRWEDIDFDQNIISIRKQRYGNDSIRSNVKTHTSTRSIRIGNSLMEILKRHKEIQERNREAFGDAFKANGFVCCHADGSLPNVTHFSRWFRLAAEKHGFEPIRYHDLRHSFATNMIRLGVPINTVSKMLGHASVTITLDTYAHVLEEMQEEAVVKMDEDLSKYLSDLDNNIDSKTENYNTENYIDDISLEDDEDEWEL